jgi:hypothetical protein
MTYIRVFGTVPRLSQSSQVVGPTRSTNHIIQASKRTFDSRNDSECVVLAQRDAVYK